MRKLFELSDAQLARVLEASKPVPYLIAGGREPISPQERANAVWSDLGREMGFEYMTVRPSERGVKFFTAETSDASTGAESK